MLVSRKYSFWHRPLMLAAGYPKALIPFHVPNNIPSTSTWPVCHGKYNEVNNGSYLLPDPKCTCNRCGFPSFHINMAGLH
jgi:hypothetical protein